jgi:asparagine synthase (glutamine-hydrolysing)
MCGIAGMIHQDGRPIDRDLLRQMTDVLAHRGPDGEGFVIDGPVGFGHRRLAIIDLTAGAQPMSSEDGTVCITYNGEVYNYQQLRGELQGLGHRFRTASDTEVILRGYEAWGVDVLPRLRGMFAFAILDRRRRRLLLARDRLGIKPLVYAWDGAGLRFASEIKSILQDPRFRRDLDWEAVRDYFTYLFVPDPRTIFRGVRKLPPASYLTCSLDGGEPEVRRYWHLRMAPDPTVSEAEWLERLIHLLDESVALHMVSDVPLGAFLSGGVDSSAVVACMARASRLPVKTFSIGFDEADFDELAYARSVAARYRTDHFEMVVKPDVINILPRLAWQFDEPFGDASAVPTYCVSRIAREHVTVALSGDGGDEAFAGYLRYAKALSLNRQAERPLLSLLAPLFARVASALPEGIRGRGFLELLAAPPLLRYFRLMTFQRDATLARLLAPEVHTRVLPRPDLQAYVHLAHEAGTGRYLSLLQYLDTHHYLPGDILTKVDRTSMLTSLENRVPLLDHALIEFAATMPESLKFRAGVGKYILKQAMKDHLPEAILTRRKMGFAVPLAAWLRRELKDFAVDVLSDRQATQRGIIRSETATDYLERHSRGKQDLSPQIWSLICFELWCRTWLDR